MRISRQARDPFHRTARLALVTACLLAGAACTGSIGDSTPRAELERGMGPGETPGEGRPVIPAGEALDCSEAAFEPPSTVLPRITRGEYLNALDDLFGYSPSEDALETLPFELRAPSVTTAQGQTTDLFHVESYARIAEELAATMDGFDAYYDTDCADCARAFIEGLGAHVFSRPLRDAEVDGFLPIFTLVEDEGDPVLVAHRLVLRAMLQSPQFLYHLEDLRRRDDAIADLNPDDLARRLAFLVWQGPADETLRAEAAALTSTSAIEAAVRRMAADPRGERAALAFVEDWMDLTRLERAVSTINERTKAAMREETDRFVVDVLENGGLLDLLEGDYTFLNDRAAAPYGRSAGSGFERVDLSDDRTRVGLLTQPAVIAAHSNGNRPSVVSRGLFLLRDLMCRDVPNPPVTADTESTELPEDASERDKSAERLGRGACGGCHQHFDPMAYAFEIFDGAGQVRELDEHGNAIIPEGWLPAIRGTRFGDGAHAIDQPYDDITGLVELLRESPVVAECATEKVLTYTLRRRLQMETISDACAVRQITERAAALGGTYEDLLVAVATSPAFTTVRTAE
ncbi:MAG: DUF1588 domain-containing protein [Myxococcota bacterium]